ncbi:MAG: helix-turn-helix domain-containing protein [Anaerolineae bacterium]
MLTAQLPLDELVRLGLGGRFRVLAGSAGLIRSVAWVNTVAGVNIKEYQPSSGELVLLTPPYDDLPLPRLASCGAAGVILLPCTLPPRVLEWAEQAHFAIVELDGQAELSQVQRELLRLLVDKEAGLVAQKAEIYQRLTRLSVENQGLVGITRAVAELTHHGVVVQDKRVQVLAAVPPRDLWPAWSAIVEGLAAPGALPAEFQDRRRAGRVREPQEQSLANGAMRLVTPIIVRDIARGFISIVSPAGQFGALDRIALEQGAAACALEMAKVKAVSEARKKLTGDLIEAILTQSVNETDAGRWADRAGYRRAGPHVVMTLQWLSSEAPSFRRLETIVSGEVKRLPSRAVAILREDEIVVLYAASADQELADALQWAQRIYDLAHEEFPHAQLGLGVGRLSDSLLGLRQSYQEARQAMKLEHKLRQGRPQYFGDLGVYRLILPLLGSSELDAFVDQMLGDLIDYDRSKGGNLVETLSAYFQHNANLVQTAQALYLHRNTLLYRLQRAGEIGKFDLDNPETRLALQLALRAHDLARQEPDFMPPL